ncbi:hypothetical protein FRC15_004424 [Serendipita sp. 397]|nr:hypothetical protein FRC15_004424 [Serendipita sp. 397]
MSHNGNRHPSKKPKLAGVESVLGSAWSQTSTGKAAQKKAALKKQLVRQNVEKPIPRKNPEDGRPSSKDKGQKATTSKLSSVLKVPTKAKDSKMANDGGRLLVVAGCYEKILYGLEIDLQKREKGDEGEERAGFTPVFVFPAHISCVKAVAASRPSGKWLASGGTDESIKIWDLRRRKELGSLQQHQGSVTHLSFPTRTHLLSASEDGTICVYHTRDWAVLATLRGHKDRVNDVAVHPSAKVCLSVGKDRTLRMWDLMRGKGSASVKLGKEGEGVRWTSSGTRFAVISASTLDIYSTKMALLQTIHHPARIQAIHFCRDQADREFALIAAEDKLVTIYLLPSLAEDAGDGDESSIPIVATLNGHTNRVKAIDSIIIQKTTYVTSVSSDGRIHLYDLTDILGWTGQSDPLSVDPMAVYDTKGSRLTCVTVTDCGDTEMANSDGLPRKRKHTDESEGDEEEEEEEEEGEDIDGDD